MNRAAGGALAVGAILLAGYAAARLGGVDLTMPAGVAVVPGGAQTDAPAPFAANTSPVAAPAAAAAPDTTAVRVTPVATFFQPWAMVFLPDGRMLVTEKPGRMRLVTQAGTVSAPIAGLPPIAYSTGQGGLLDVAIDPGHAANRRVWWSYAEAGSGGSGLAVARGTLTIADDGSARMDDVAVIWRQFPRVDSTQQFGGRIAFSPDGKLFIAAGDRNAVAKVQLATNTIGKIVRLNLDGSVPADNPYVGQPYPRAEIFTLGHRNPYGLVFARNGRLYETEMGPAGGDEFNQIPMGRNYGWPLVSEGDRYGGPTYPRHASNPRFAAPLVAWTPVIAPGGMIQYTGTRFVGWDGDFVIAGLAGQALVRVRVRGGPAASEVGRIAMGVRMREVELGPDGAIWALEDGARGRLVRLDPAG